MFLQFFVEEPISFAFVASGIKSLSKVALTVILSLAALSPIVINPPIVRFPVISTLPQKAVSYTHLRAHET